MDIQTDARQTARVFKALAHPTRILIIKTLLEKERCVLSIRDILHTSQPNVSQHLNILKNVGIVDFEQTGNLRCYFLTEPDKIRAVFNTMG